MLVGRAGRASGSLRCERGLACSLLQANAAVGPRSEQHPNASPCTFLGQKPAWFQPCRLPTASAGRNGSDSSGPWVMHRCQKRSHEGCHSISDASSADSVGQTLRHRLSRRTPGAAASSSRAAALSLESNAHHRPSRFASRCLGIALGLPSPARPRRAADPRLCGWPGCLRLAGACCRFTAHRRRAPRCFGFESGGAKTHTCTCLPGRRWLALRSLMHRMWGAREGQRR